MVAHCVAALLYLGVIHGELAHEPLVRDALWRLLADAHYGYAATEEAMFIVREGDGRLTFVRWERTGIPHHAQWKAAVPRGTVAIVHTHPNTMPRPSRLDEQTAVHNNLPVYVVTRTKIMKTSRGQTDVVLKGEWWTGG
jgi:Prokaryotic homologs of the JAB domain